MVDVTTTMREGDSDTDPGEVLRTRARLAVCSPSSVNTSGSIRILGPPCLQHVGTIGAHRPRMDKAGCDGGDSASPDHSRREGKQSGTRCWLTRWRVAGRVFGCADRGREPPGSVDWRVSFLHSGCPVAHACQGSVEESGHLGSADRLVGTVTERVAGTSGGDSRLG